MSTRNKNLIEIGIIALTLITAVLHLIFVFTLPFNGRTFILDIASLEIELSYQMLFIFSFSGYIGLLIAFLAPQLVEYKDWVRVALIVYTALTILLYIIRHIDSLFYIEDVFFIEGVINKIVEVVLVILLLYDQMKSEK